MRRLLKFLITGALGTGIHYAVLYALVAAINSSPTLAAILGAICGALFNYSFNRRITFESKSSHRTALPKYVAMSILGIAITGAVVYSAVEVGLHYWLGQIAATLIVIIFNYMVASRLIFKT